MDKNLVTMDFYSVESYRGYFLKLKKRQGTFDLS